jgi:hypothetical protein
MNCDLDHLVVLAATLDEGAAWCEATLGVAPGAGGRHALMGTHNRLLRIDGEGFPRSEERRVGKECRRLCRSRWSPYH